MSQTLSLPPGRYSLFITPPVAGTDFTGTPTPSVSYQWKKNGTAIAGQTAATISGVWVGETGGTVDLVDGDTISIDIILTNPVQVTTKAVSAVIDASIPAPTITPLSIRLVSAPNDPVSAIPNASIGSQIMVASAGSVSVVTTPPLLPTYQWRRGFAPIAGATAQTYTLQAADADSIIDCVVSATSSGGTTTRTATATVGTLPAAGWTELTPSADSRLIYVSADGDDVAAASVKGRGYYLPSDPEIGDDPTNPVGPIVAYRTHFEAAKRVRLSACVGEDANGFPTYGSGGPGGFPDWVLLRRGDSFTENPVFDHPNSGVATAYNLGALLGGPEQPGQGWRQNQNKISLGTGDHRGRSASEPAVVTAWGNPSDPRPVVKGYTIGGRTRHVRIVSVNVERVAWGWSDGGSAGDVLIEDCKARTCNSTFLSVWTYDRGLVLRRCVISGSYSGSGNIQGLFVALKGTAQQVTIEECVFDRNGYKEDPFDATTWTANVVSTGVIGAIAAGSGKQPTRNALDRNIYIATGDGATHQQTVIRGCIFSRNGGGGSVQMRQGGICERNLFIWNEDAGTYICGPGVLFVNNSVIHDDHMLPTGGWGIGPATFNSENWNNQGSGWSLDSNLRFVIADNCIAHYHRITNGGSMLNLYNASDTHWVSINSGQPLGTILSGTIIATGNCINADRNPAVRILNWGTLDDLAFGGNAIASVSGRLVESSATHMTSLASKGSVQYAIGDSGVGGNKYFSTLASPFGNQTFAQWQANRAGIDSASAFFSDFAAFKAAAGWTAPERDIVSYMESVDPTYVVNEDVYIDEDAAVKQASRQKVWEVLSNSAAYPNNTWWQTNGLMSEARAKLTARRYHAFVTFIQRAKENRKGAWDPRWTAEAVNNYIRAGFGKAAVTGAYDTRSLADRLLDYTI